MFGFLKSRKARKQAEIAAIEAAMHRAVQPFKPASTRPVSTWDGSWMSDGTCRDWDHECKRFKERQKAMAAAYMPRNFGGPSNPRKDYTIRKSNGD